MKVSYKWLQEYLDINDITADELAEKMSRTGVEVDGVIKPSEGLSKIVVGLTLEVVDHPDSDHLHICQVDVGADEPIQIVCGAPNIAAGQKVIVALHGARIAGNYKIKKGKIRGEVSNGMICSLDELGYPESVIPKKYADGIFVLPEDTEIGLDVTTVLNMDDQILDIDITPNRADALSMRGVAHEVAAIYNKKATFQVPQLPEQTGDINDYISVEVSDTKDAPAYHIQVIKDVKIAESPLWLQTKLMNAGIRPINNVVDITNYILIEYGQPLHAFDYDEIGSRQIKVRRANEGELFTTLDGVERTLDQSNIVITNGSEPIALAGVMGGLDSEITDKTVNVALEAALFDALSIRKTGTKFNLRSESSARFEKGINVATIQEAGHYAAQLMSELAGGTIVAGTASVDTIKSTDVTVAITLEKINRTLGTEIPLTEVEAIFEQLGFGHSVTGDLITVSVPPRRWDISIEADIIEEVARIYGYDRLPATLPVTAGTPGKLTNKQKVVRQSRNYLEAAGLTQNISYVLTTQDKAKAFTLETGEPIRLAWPMSEDRSTLRMNLLASLLENATYNVARKNSDIQFYEIGKIFLPNEADVLPIEAEQVAGILTGNVASKNWQQESVAVDFYHVKGILEAYFESMGVLKAIRFEANRDIDWMHPGRTANIILNNEVIGYVGQVYPGIASEYDLKDTYVFEFNLDAVLNVDKTMVSQQPIPKFPGISRDLAILVSETVTHEEIKAVIEAKAGKNLVNVQLFDIYQGKGIEEGMKSMAYSLAFLNPTATLVDEEVTSAVETVKLALSEELNATIR
ncbi:MULTISPECIES: phenylalanine--tRNA ligase subunit beta [unclassified Jeotgalibaca]|uniref:phenylalanine--tRNA ligase subunit beta n=1 Tax=unclassified Jeotgalibaca TaxID=2621505 RepID=UPI003FCF5641